ncbi:amidase family protein [Marinobacter similis]|uniref:hypothetical protein n=1 Tax=Marinobacter similis TaxID=1420916 RepID=UPI000B172AC4|nr:hypothetical protein [Marinobacter similis]
MKQSEYLRYDATALADLIQRGEVTPREVCEAAIDRATRVNGSLNAICHPQFTEALEQEFPASSVFSGVPLLLKDLAQEQAGHPCTYGSRGLTRNIAPRIPSLSDVPGRPAWCSWVAPRLRNSGSKR